ncbi:MAG TPA: fimbrial assembly protein [Noviherbaspirillum sp.]
MRLHFHPPHKQSGVALLEGLIAILIFSLGILSLVGMQAVAVKQSTDARYRTEAALLAERLIGAMWVDNHSTLATNYATGGSAYNNWLADVSDALPKVADNPPVVDVSAGGDVTITIYWQQPGDQTSAAMHKYIINAHIE